MYTYRASLFRNVLVGLTVSSTLLAASPALSQSVARVSVNPATVEIRAGETAQLTVDVSDVQGLYGVDLALRFDPSVIEVVDASPGQGGVEVSGGTFLEGGFAILNQADNAAGTIRYATTQLNPAEPKSGSGALILFTVRAKRAGSSTALTVEKAELADRDGMLIASAISPGRVVVTPEGQAAPTMAVIATATPSAALPATAVPATQPPAATTVPPPATATPPPGAPAAPTNASALPALATPTATTNAAPTSASVDAPAATDQPAAPPPDGAVATATPDSAPTAIATLDSAATALPAAAIAADAPPAHTPAAEVAAAQGPPAPAAAPVALPAAQPQLQPGLLSPKLELALVTGACGSGFIVISALVAGVFILLLQRHMLPANSRNAARHEYARRPAPPQQTQRR